MSKKEILEFQKILLSDQRIVEIYDVIKCSNKKAILYRKDLIYGPYNMGFITLKKFGKNPGKQSFNLNDFKQMHKTTSKILRSLESLIGRLIDCK